VRWLAGDGADTALEGLPWVEAKAVCALTPPPTAVQVAGARAGAGTGSGARGS
jgi:hypothetical protein